MACHFQKGTYQRGLTNSLSLLEEVVVRFHLIRTGGKICYLILLEQSKSEFFHFSSVIEKPADQLFCYI